MAFTVSRLARFLINLGPIYHKVTVTGSHVAIGHQLSAVSGGRWLIRLILRLEWQF